MSDADYAAIATERDAEDEAFARAARERTADLERRAYYDNIERLANAGRARHGSELQRMFNAPPPRRREPVTVRRVLWTAGAVAYLLPFVVAAEVRRRWVGYMDRIDLGNTHR